MSFLRESDFLGKLEQQPDYEAQLRNAFPHRRFELDKETNIMRDVGPATHPTLAQPSQLMTSSEKPYSGRFPSCNFSSVSVPLNMPLPGQTTTGTIPTHMGSKEQIWEWHTHESDALHYAADGFLCKCGSQKNCKGSLYYPTTVNPHRVYDEQNTVVFGMANLARDNDKDEELDDIDTEMIDEPTSLLPTTYNAFGVAATSSNSRQLKPFF